MSLKGTVILYTSLVYAFPKASFLILDDYAQWALVIENAGDDLRAVGSITKLEWDLREWEDYGWEIIRRPRTPFSSLRRGSR